MVVRIKSARRLAACPIKATLGTHARIYFILFWIHCGRWATGEFGDGRSLSLGASSSQSPESVKNVARSDGLPALDPGGFTVRRLR